MDKLEWGPVTEGWQLSLSVDKDKFSAGERVRVTTVARNVSKKALPLPVLTRWTTYQFRVKRGAADVPLTRFGKRQDDLKGEVGHGNTTIPAGDDVVLEILLSRLFDVSELGAYKVQATRTVFKESTREGAALVSNEITFTVVEDEGGSEE